MFCLQRLSWNSMERYAQNLLIQIDCLLKNVRFDLKTFNLNFYTKKLYEGKFDVIKKDKYISSKFTIKANDLSQEFLQINLNRFIFSVDKEKNCLLIKKELDNRHASYIREMRDTKDIIAKTRVVVR